MNTESRLSLLHYRTAVLLRTIVNEIEEKRRNVPEQMEGRFCIAAYLLTEVEEYVNAAWDLLKADRARASLTVSRWVIEAALNLVWATAESNELDRRIRLLVAEALRLEAARLGGLAELYPNEAKQLTERATAARQQLKALVAEAKWRLDPLDKRMKSVIRGLRPKALPNPYALYRVCCGAAHPGLDVWRRFGQGAGGATATREPPDHTAMACFIIASSTLWLVSAACCLTGLGDSGHLTRWWTDEVAPLLACAPV